jgi:hypothetical protein
MNVPFVFLPAPAHDPIVTIIPLKAGNQRKLFSFTFTHPPNSLIVFPAYL